MARTIVESWGRTLLTESEVAALHWRTDPFPILPPDKTLLPYGLGRSYGDSCLNEGEYSLPTRSLDHWIQLDRETGSITCEAGLGLHEVMERVLPLGWFLPVSPGTKFITVGGAIANDVHGKNHHIAGCFSNHVTRFELLRSDGSRTVCSRSENTELFNATVGGLGLTGILLWAQFQLRRVCSPNIDQEIIRYGTLDEFFALSAESQNHEYVVAWIDCLASKKELGRGLLIRGNHSEEGALGENLVKAPSLSVPFDFPSFALNRFTLKAFNFAYYRKQRRGSTQSRVSYEPFFYPLDAVGNWNRIYGRRGFYQYQCVVPLVDGGAAIRDILRLISDAGMGSFLAVLKTFGDVPSPGLLSFPRPGVTLALDFPNTGSKVNRLFEELDRVVAGAGGRLYPAKDARMSARMFQQTYPRYRELERWRDPKISSSFWRRVTCEE